MCLLCASLFWWANIRGYTPRNTRFDVKSGNNVGGIEGQRSKGAKDHPSTGSGTGTKDQWIRGSKVLWHFGTKIKIACKGAFRCFVLFAPLNSIEMSGNVVKYRT